jgi:starch synthase (maltosyl-transferring)
VRLHDIGPNSSHATSPGGRANAQGHPRLYYVHPLLCGPPDAWRAHLARAAEMGFDRVLTAPLFAPAENGSVFAPADLDTVHPVLGTRRSALEVMAALVAECRRHGLALLMDFPARVLTPAAESSATEAAPDPRRLPERADAPADGARSGDVDAWCRTLRSWSGAGLAGLRCLEPQRVAMGVWRRLAEAAGMPLFAWTPGLARHELAALDGSAFERTFSSFAWWDYGSEWLESEDEALRLIAPPIAPVEAPFGPRLMRTVSTRTQAERAYRRAIRIGSAMGAGWLLPMGFEFGALHALDPVRDRPDDFAALLTEQSFDFRAEIAAANGALQRCADDGGARIVSAPHADVVVLARDAADGGMHLMAANARLERRASLDLGAVRVSTGAVRLRATDRANGAIGSGLMLEPGEAVAMRAEAPAKPVGTLSRPDHALRAARVVIEAVTPSVDDGAWPVKRAVGEAVDVEADVFCDGHSVLAADLLWQAPHASQWQAVRLQPVVNDRWRASFPLEALGLHRFRIEAWVDEYASFRDELSKKAAASVPVTLELREGHELLREAAGRSTGELREALAALLRQIEAAAAQDQLALLLAEPTAALMRRADPRRFLSRSAIEWKVLAERRAAAFASWYELFPRSQSGHPDVHGRFGDVIRELPRIRAMGFDVLYFPPIHPVGTTNRKGRNNSLAARPEDPGSPYAIGSPDGGHDAVDPRLGTLEDFLELQRAAHSAGLELAIDFAIQCSPDHPWLQRHPDWFAWRSDGSLRYAENPPKKYEDIVNVDFYAQGGKPELWLALRDIVLFWARHGVRLFRVDNPHTKPLPFWQWLIADVRAAHPDAIFLSEAFTRPKMMYRLAKIGFSQSYTYFTWRNEKRELEDYFRELADGPARDFFRPHLFVNTPDINPYFLQTSGRPGFLIRAALAATLSGLWGLYSGFEVCEAAALPGREEYLDAEKYEIRVRDWGAPGNIRAEITQLNALRRANPALQTHLGVHFLNAFNDRIICYEKATPARDNVVLVAISLDPHNAQEADFECPLWEWGISDHGSVLAEDLLRGGEQVWTGKIQHIRLEPSLPYAIWRLRPLPVSA